MPGAFGHDYHLPWRQRFGMIAKLDGQRSGHDQEQLVGFGMAMPLEIALRLGQPDFIVIVTPDDARGPMVRKLRELGLQLYFCSRACQQ